MIPGNSKVGWPGADKQRGSYMNFTLPSHLSAQFLLRAAVCVLSDMLNN